MHPVAKPRLDVIIEKKVQQFLLGHVKGVVDCFFRLDCVHGVQSNMC